MTEFCSSQLSLRLALISLRTLFEFQKFCLNSCQIFPWVFGVLSRIVIVFPWLSSVSLVLPGVTFGFFLSSLLVRFPFFLENVLSVLFELSENVLWVFSVLSWGSVEVRLRRCICFCMVSLESLWSLLKFSVRSSVRSVCTSCSNLVQLLVLGFVKYQFYFHGLLRSLRTHFEFFRGFWILLFALFEIS